MTSIESTDTTTEVWWSMPNGGTEAHPTFDQTYSPNGATECGVTYQVDLYWTSFVPGLIADGLLTGSTDANGVITSAEDWNGALAYGAREGNPWRYEQAQACDTKPEPTVTAASSWVSDCATGLATTTATTTTTDYLLIGNVWTEQEPVTSEPTVTTAPLAATDCLQLPTLPETVATTSTVPELAYTGSAPLGVELILPAIIALALIGAGIGALRKARA